MILVTSMNIGDMSNTLHMIKVSALSDRYVDDEEAGGFFLASALAMWSSANQCDDASCS